ncbi:hypothetical protein [Streptomyces sp. NPDC048172]|uniref:hypothetical protein n=1 Tax=Streptomyces sp. NPDC048172 TaxID=3365505 RepID=UPI0037144D65
MSDNQPGPYGQQPGPYGQQPQQPGPYGQQQPQYGGAQGQPGYGYPQQGQQPGGYQQQPPPQQQGGYGYPQQGQPQQPQQPYGQPGQPGMPMPPQGGGSSKGKTIGIIVGALVVVGAVIGGILFFTGGDDDGGGGKVADDGKKYKLITPATVAGSYQKSPSGGGSGFDSEAKSDFEEFGVKNLKDVNAAYKSGSGMSAKQLQFAGVYGDIDDPEKVLDAAFGKMAQEASKEGGKTKLEGSPEKVSPAGADDAVMKCQNASTEASPGKTVKIPFCMWADHSTVGTVMSVDLAAAMTGKSAPISEAAETTAKVRKDTRVEIK